MSRPLGQFELTEAKQQAIDVWLVFAGTALSAFIAWLLFFDVPLLTRRFVLEKPEGKAVAQLRLLEKTVRHKSDSLLAWNTASADEVLYLNDQVFTDEDSSAAIEFSDRTLVEVSQKSLVVVRLEDEHHLLHVKEGSVSAKLVEGSNLVLELADKKIQLTSIGPAAVSVQAGREGEVRLEVLQGSIEVKESGETISVGENQQAVVGTAGLSAAPVAIALLGPEHSAVLPMGKGGSGRDVAFSWSGAQDGRFVFQLAGDLNFKRLMRDEKTDRPDLLVPSVGPGRYFWRVAELQEGKVPVFGAPRSVTIAGTAAPALFSPADGTVLGLMADEDVRTAYFDWQQVAAAESYEIESARNPEFSGGTQVALASRPPAMSSPLAVGIHYWRVRGVIGGVKTDWSLPRRFNIEKMTSAASASGDLRSLHSIAPADATPAHMAPPSVAGIGTIDRVAIEASRQETLTPVKDAEDSSLFGAVEGPPQTAALLQPDDGAVFEKSSALLPITFRWRPVPGAESYLFEVFRATGGKAIISEQISSTETVRAFTRENRLHWQVTPRMIDGSLGKPSPPSTLAIVPGTVSVSPVGLGTVAQESKPAASEPGPQQSDTPVLSSSPVSGNQQSEGKTPPYVQRWRPEVAALHITLAPTRLESVTTTRTSRHLLRANASSAVHLHGEGWLSPEWGMEGGYRRVKTTLFDGKGQGQGAVPLTMIDAVLAVKHRIPLDALAETYLDPRLAFMRKSSISVLGQEPTGPVSIKQRVLTGFAAGFALERALAEYWWFKGFFDYFLSGEEPGGSHYLAGAQLTRLLRSGFKWGAAYDFEFARYRSKDGQEVEKNAMRRQSLGIIIGLSF